MLIYFTGHGFTAGEDEDEAQGCLATQDCQIEVAGNRVLSVRKGLSFQSLNGLISRAELRSLVMFLDCCHGGSFVESAQARQKLSALNKTRYCLVTACRGFEQAAAMKAATHSIFSASVLAALRADAETVTALDVMRRVEQDLKGTGQEPVYVGAGSDVPILERRQTLATTQTSEENPYQSLNAFTSKTAEFFFGRDADVDLLVQQLTKANFVPVLGPSGSGKSSVVRAGLVTRLREQGWQEVVMKPGKSPFVMLEAVLREFLESIGVSRGELTELLGYLPCRGYANDYAQPPISKDAEPDSRALSVVEGRLAQANTKLLLIIDQFEEVFTLCEDKQMQKSFVELLLLKPLVASSLSVVMTMRSDFVDDWLRVGLSPSVIRNDTVWLGPLVDENLVAAIVEPARRQGYELEPGLLQILLRDVAAEENCLPLLEFALTELWGGRDSENRLLTLDAYNAMGGLTGALNSQATIIYNNLREEVEQPWAKGLAKE